MGKGNNNEQIVKNKMDPWSPIAPYLRGAFDDLSGLYRRGAPNFFPGQLVAPMSDYSRDAFKMMGDRARNGNPLMGQASDEISKIMRGDYLDPSKNPGLQGAMDAAIRPITRAFSENVMPGIDSSFSSAGRYGSGLQGAAYSDASQDMARSVGDVSSNMAFQNYGMERGNMMNALGMAPMMAQEDWNNIRMLGLAGQGLEGYDQRLIDAERERYDYNANKDMNWLRNYIGLLGGAPPPSSTQNIKTPAPNPWMTGLGLGLQGLGMFGGGLGGLFGGLFGNNDYWQSSRIY